MTDILKNEELTSKLFAKISGKNHNSIILRDIKKEIAELFDNQTLTQVLENKHVANMQHPVYQLFIPVFDNRNYVRYFIMSKKGWYQLAARYDAKLRYKLVNIIDNQELITPKQAAYSLKLINFFQFVENQILARKLHEKTFIKKHGENYMAFNIFRNKEVLGMSKNEID